MKPRPTTWRILASTLMFMAMLLPGAGATGASAQQALGTTAANNPRIHHPQLSSIYQMQKGRRVTQATSSTSCPQHFMEGDDIRVNQDLSCRPQDETSIAIDPTGGNNQQQSTSGHIVAGANDYRTGFGSSGFYVSRDNGRTWYDGILPFPTVNGLVDLDGGGDPAVTFDRAGNVYYADINFQRFGGASGVFVHRSTNGGYTWAMPCVPSNNQCSGPGDSRRPGDGVVDFTYGTGSDRGGASSNPLFLDKEYIAAGPRPAGVAPQCFDYKGARVACQAGTVGVDRLYVTYTRFIYDSQGNYMGSPIYMSYSDDKAYSWSPPKSISGNAAFCVDYTAYGILPGCSVNQGSVPVVQPKTGTVYVSYYNGNSLYNGNTFAEDQYLMVKSTNGGQTFTNPYRAATVYDINYPTSGQTRPDCEQRGAGKGTQVLTNSCFRVDPFGNMIVDPRGGAFANDLYLVFSDNRFGTNYVSNTDVFLYKSTDGGNTWWGPTRVNSDWSGVPASRSCTTATSACTRSYGRDQWFPWAAMGQNGELNVAFNDRRLDRNSTRIEWPMSRQVPGNYFYWFFDAQCHVTLADSKQCVAPTATHYTGRPAGPVVGPRVAEGANQTVFPLSNVSVSDVPSNPDYTFRAGLFMGDYSGIAVANGRAYPFWTDARNGRSSRFEYGRNPICEQSDVYLDVMPALGARNDSSAALADSRYLVSQCP